MKRARTLLKNIHWPVALFFLGIMATAVVGTPLYLLHFGFEWPIWIAALIFGFLTILSVTAGYHRFIAHRSYRAESWLKVVYLLVGSAAWQASAMKWATDHRRHHRHVDTEGDPYNIQEGFWHAHMGWLFTKDDPKFHDKFASDLQADRWIRWQHNNYIPIAIVMGFVVPMGVGALLGNAIGGVLIIGCLRIVAVHQLTFFINSLCHMVGSRPYSDKVSARDNGVLAIFTCGEGYHNFHHRFASDYRNGVHWYHWDPAKWFIRLASYFGWTHSLKKISNHEIMMVRFEQEGKWCLKLGANPDRTQLLRTFFIETLTTFRAFTDEYQNAKKSAHARSSEALIKLKKEMKCARREFRAACRQWRQYRNSYIERGIPASA